jgi:fermentation-respiration switch protein FrsA (DUF1100 family)
MSQQPDGYTFEKSADVRRTAVRYRNRYGIELAGDLYVPADLDQSAKHPAVVVGPPYGGVKEQGPGVYGNALAQRGVVVLAFDPSFNGDSGGDTRHVASPEIFAEDFSAGVDFLGTLGYVDRARIGAIGICGSGGFALNAAAIDTRIAAVAAVALVDISRVQRNGAMDSQTDEGRRKTLETVAGQRWADVDAGEPALTPVFPHEYQPDGLDPMTAEFHEYYVTDRGHHPRSIGGFTVTSTAAHIHAGPVHGLDDIAPRPVLLVTGDQAMTRWFTDTLHADANGVGELIVVPGARHIDLYDRTDLIPFDRLAELFTSQP